MIRCTDERAIVARVLRQGFSPRGKNLEYYLLAKYYREETGLGRAACLREILRLCQKQDADFAFGDGYRDVTRQVNRAYRDKQGLIAIAALAFPKALLGRIEALPLPPETKKVLFTLCCLQLMEYAAGRAGRWLYVPLAKLKAYANLPQKTAVTALLHQLCEKGLLFVSDRGALTLPFLESDGQQANADEACVRIDAGDFSHLGLVYAYLSGEKGMMRCQQCGMLIKKRGNRQRYCPACAHARKLTQYAVYNGKRRQPACDHQ